MQSGIIELINIEKFTWVCSGSSLRSSSTVSSSSDGNPRLKLRSERRLIALVERPAVMKIPKRYWHLFGPCECLRPTKPYYFKKDPIVIYWTQKFVKKNFIHHGSMILTDYFCLSNSADSLSLWIGLNLTRLTAWSCRS